MEDIKLCPGEGEKICEAISLKRKMFSVLWGHIPPPSPQHTNTKHEVGVWWGPHGIEFKWQLRNIMWSRAGRGGGKREREQLYLKVTTLLWGKEYVSSSNRPESLEPWWVLTNRNTWERGPQHWESCVMWTFWEPGAVGTEARWRRGQVFVIHFPTEGTWKG